MPVSVALATLTGSLKVVFPVALFVCTKSPNISISPKSIAPEFVIVTSVRPVETFAGVAAAPKMSPTLTVPVPASIVKVSLPGPASPMVVPDIVSEPPPVCRITSCVSAISRLPPMVIFVFVVVILLARSIAPVTEKPD